MQNSIIEFPEEISAHVFSLLTCNELHLFGKINKQIYKNTKTLVFLRRVHTIIREGSVFDTIWWNLYDEKEEKQSTILEGIVAKISTLDDDIVSFNFITYLDTSSIKNFNKRIHGHGKKYKHSDDMKWWLDILDILNPPHQFIPGPLSWTPDEQEMVDLWNEQYNNNYYHKMEL